MKTSVRKNHRTSVTQDHSLSISPSKLPHCAHAPVAFSDCAHCTAFFSLLVLFFLSTRLEASHFLSITYRHSNQIRSEENISEIFELRLLSCSVMDCSSSCSLVLCGKSSAENEVAKLVKSGNNLKLPDYGEISISLHSEIKRTANEESFQFESFMNSLLTNQFGRFLIWSPRLPSTHDVVSHNFCELPVGAVCVADVQFKGRGRSKNQWESPVGCLMFSFTIKMEDGRVVPLLQYVVSLAVTEAIKNVCYTNGLPLLDVKIKWPNDLYLNGLKVGGILCTSTYRSKKFNVSAGIGLNVDNKKPTTCLNAVLRELSSVAYNFKREDIIAAFFNKFENFFNLFIDQGFQPLEELYYKTWLHSGQRVVVQEKHMGELVETVVTIQGLTSAGYLLAIGEDNQLCELHPDGNSFDFFKGLVRRKLD